MPQVIEKKRRFDRRDLDTFAEYIADELGRRRGRRKDKEEHWREIDRQIAMIPDISYKKGKNGQAVPSKAWMSEMEPALQAQTLEVLTADAKRMIYPDSGPWFSAHALLSDEYLDRADFSSIIAGDQNDVPSVINQDNADKLVEGWLNHLHRQYKFWDNIDKINAEAFKYGVGIGRGRMATKELFIDSVRGTVRKNAQIPVLVPRSIWNTYLDDSEHATMNEGVIVGPSTLYCWKQKVEDLVLAAKRGSTDPDDPNGGWMPAAVSGIEGDASNNQVEVIEYEGDMLVPRKTVRSLFVPNVIVTVVKARKDNKPRSQIVRLRFRKYPYSTYIPFPYHNEDVDSPYATSPLMKGRVIQLAAAQALSRLFDSAAIKAEPPIRWDSTDIQFASDGGPMIYPGAMWGTDSGIEVFDKIGGDPAALMQVYIALLQQYADETGTQPPRLGAQTVSHTTAYAKEAELQRGTVRTVDYVKGTLDGPLATWLYMEYDMSRDVMRGEHTFYLDAYRGFVTIDKDKLPDMAVFDVFGAGGPAEEREKQQNKLAAIQLAIQIDQLKVQSGLGQPMNYDEIQKQIMHEGGWVDVDPFFNATSQQVSGGASPESGVPGDIESNPGAQTVALQALSGGE